MTVAEGRPPDKGLWPPGTTFCCKRQTAAGIRRGAGPGAAPRRPRRGFQAAAFARRMNSLPMPSTSSAPAVAKTYFQYFSVGTQSLRAGSP
jgi:hypothetical protein